MEPPNSEQIICIKLEYLIPYNCANKSLKTNLKGQFKKEQLQWNIEIIIFTNPSARAGYDTRSVFKRSLTGLNSEFSFS